MCGWGPYAREASVWEACCRYSGVINMFLDCLTQAKGANSVTQSDFLCANPLLDEWHSWLECSGNTQRTLQKWPPKSPSGILHALVSDDSSAPISCAQCSAVYHRAVKSVAGWVGPVITWAAGWSRGCSMGACVGA